MFNADEVFFENCAIIQQNIARLELENSILSAKVCNLEGKNSYLIGELQNCSEKFAHHGLNLSEFLTNEAIKVGRKL